ncbi:CRISPR-associated endoribonuclease Cas2 1 [Caldalkalibacillus thermarum]|uniref:CRISPR-associated endonuclease Cas2 n=1 Tax=Caldalkalibacillus thermarum TaxID=296745 RepID=UPI001666BE6B|nr:CRISPR-associated endonuclease Cas2 [Caldalkalibacillus thermarum]GGK34653.1 CRISPR-associated endoribonuclease Cas2 1 [Caldalkalibacillus thermarum]
MDILVTYDVETQETSGQKRLRQVATICQNFGQRVQKSVFECRVTQSQLEEMVHQLLRVIDKERDSLRIYMLYGDRNRVVRVYGRDDYIDYDHPIIV